MRHVASASCARRGHGGTLTSYITGKGYLDGGKPFSHWWFASTASAVIFPSRRTVAVGVRICTRLAAPSRLQSG